MRFSTLPRLWRFVLIGSLALNLAVAGVVLGQVFDGPDRDRGPRMGGPAAPLVRALDKPDRQALVDDLRAGPRGPRGRGLESVLEALRAIPFDPEALQIAFAEARRIGDARVARTEAALIDRLTQMSPEARDAYADRLAKSFRRPR
ncbi:hypothetical protein PARPLA_00698 [Rhodobacteraceae bacterium THAF1]|uniref:periplasmic heavy metal sensor n=1 Tax=Palleronia sp. THAF1 TaxID=2587842 RepID=UPI000F411FD7|nr:periplasmic heavy metal sensor [Palleronia sp. THAF1]QFU09739.1 hypothetical protein FIU81_13770 [Palleronia sp. THAF1]VDC17358.1 hypothetical protein PARPLA_00698 [Rhodobacteraceae bacterium THAF1]